MHSSSRKSADGKDPLLILDGKQSVRGGAAPDYLERTALRAYDGRHGDHRSGGAREQRASIDT